MKKNYFLTVSLLIFVVISSFAQETDTVKFKSVWYIGGGGNFNSSWIVHQNTYGEPLMKYEFTPTFGINANVGVEAFAHWGFKMELGYALLGQKYNEPQYGLPANRTINLNYFLLPVMIKYRVGSEKTKFYAMAGPQLGLLLSASQVYKRNGENAPVYDNSQVGFIDVSKANITDRYTQAAFFIRMDLGVELKPSKHFMIDIGLSTAYSVTDLNGTDWRLLDDHGEYHSSHDFYGGLNLGFNYIF
jgi:hypothetical protein